MKYEWNVSCINRNARPNNKQLITYSLLVHYLLRIQQYPVNITYYMIPFFWICLSTWMPHGNTPAAGFFRASSCCNPWVHLFVGISSREPQFIGTHNSMILLPSTSFMIVRLKKLMREGGMEGNYFKDCLDQPIHMLNYRASTLVYCCVLLVERTLYSSTSNKTFASNPQLDLKKN